MLVRLIWLSVSIVCYKLFLNRETFFESNRLFLLVGIASAFLLPLITFTKYIEVEPTLTETAFGFGDAISQTIVTDNQISLTSILTYIYIAGVLFLLSRFLFQFGSLVLLFIKSTKQLHGDMMLISKVRLSSDRSLQLDFVKLESLVIAYQQ